MVFGGLSTLDGEVSISTTSQIKGGNMLSEAMLLAESLYQPEIVRYVDAGRGETSQGIYRSIGACERMMNPVWDDPVNLINPVATASAYFRNNENRKMPILGTFKLLESPKNGTLVDFDDSEIFGKFYQYIPNKDFRGSDKVVFLVELAGKKIKVTHFITVPEGNIGTFGGTDGYNIYRDKKFCPKGEYWRISSNSDEIGTLPFSLSFTALSGTGPAAQITLDTDAAGYGRFIDYTPYLNNEFLPTSNPDEWAARPGSAAEGKKDRLTVLLHEYGHALGLDHSADAYDFMAATLQPGVRRTLSVDEQRNSPQKCDGYGCFYD